MSSSLLKKTLQRRSATLLFKSFSKLSFHSSPLLSKITHSANQHSSAQKIQKSDPPPTGAAPQQLFEQSHFSNVMFHRFITAMHNGDEEGVKTWLTSLPQVVFIKFENASSPLDHSMVTTPLMYCAGTGRCVMVQEILQTLPAAFAAKEGKSKDFTESIKEHVNLKLNQPQSNALHQVMVGTGNPYYHKEGPPDVINYYKCVELLVNHPATDLNCLTEPYKQTPVYLAAKHGSTSIVDLLLRNGVSVDIFNSFNQTPLHVAVQEGHIDTAVLLVAHAVANNNLKFLTTVNTDGQTFMDVIEKRGEKEQASFHTYGLQFFGPKHNQTSLQLLAEAVKDLIGRSANGSLPAAVVEATRKVWNGHEGGEEEVQDFIGNTSLMVAAFRGELETVKKLAAASKQLARNKFGWNALHWSLIHSGPRLSYSSDVRMEIVKVLMPKTSMDECTTVDDSNVLQMSFPNPDIVRLLLETKFVKDINAKTPARGFSAFHLLIEAAKYNRIDVVSLTQSAEILVQHGASTNQRSNMNATPAMLACMDDQVAITRFFVERCGINLTDKEHMIDPENPSTTPFITACSLCSWDVVFYMMEKYNLSPNVLIGGVGNLLAVALLNIRRESPRRILEVLTTFVYKFKADINYRSDKTSTPLVYAYITKAPKETIQFLLQHGADPTIVDGQGRTIIEQIMAMRDAIIENMVKSGDSNFVDSMHQKFQEMVDLIQPYINHRNQKKIIEHDYIQECGRLFGDVPRVVENTPTKL